ncbi:MAG TPA: TRAP transporter small permease [Nitriliruptorales bacterium]
MGEPTAGPSSSALRRFVDAVRQGLTPPAPGESFGAGDPTEAPRHRSWIERVEETVAIGFFLLMFVVLLIGVFWRYVLNDPVIWTVNLGTVAFIWTVMVGNGLPNWDDDHIQFDLLYNRMPRGGQRAARMLGNLIIVVTFGMAIPATVDYLDFISVDRVTGTGLPFHLAFGGVLVFLGGTVAHRGRLLVHDVREIIAARRNPEHTP